MSRIIRYYDNIKEIEKRIRNLDALPGGLKCNYLLTIIGEGDTLIAKQWKRKAPKNLADNEILITF